MRTSDLWLAKKALGDFMPKRRLATTISGSWSELFCRGSQPGDDGIMQEHNISLESQLRDKEELVAALTARLEQAAEQLDRFRRTGADRGLRGGGFPPEMVEEQKRLVDDLARAVGQWEEMQAGAALERLEIQISDLKDLVADRLATPSGSSASLPGTATRFGSQPDGSSGHAAALTREESNSTSSIFEQYMANSEAAGESETIAPDSSDDDPVHNDEQIPVALDNPPEPIDLATASIDELREAVEERDAFVQNLIRRLRSLDFPQRLPENWEAPDQVPEDILERLRGHESRLEETLRLAEVEFSLERARLGREAAHLEECGHEIKREMKRLKLEEDEEGDEDHEQMSDDEPAAKGRWLRLLKGQRREED